MQVTDKLTTPPDAWSTEDAADRIEDADALPLLIAKSRPTKDVLKRFEADVARDDAPTALIDEPVPLDSPVSPSSPASPKSPFATPPRRPFAGGRTGSIGLTSARRLDFLRFVYTQNPGLVPSGVEGIDAAVAAASVALTSSSPPPSVRSNLSLPGTPTEATGDRRRSLVQQRISSFGNSFDSVPSPSSSRRASSSSEGISTPPRRSTWTIDPTGREPPQRSSPPTPTPKVSVTSWETVASKPGRSGSLSNATVISDSGRSSRSSSPGLRAKPSNASLQSAGTDDKAPGVGSFAEQAAAVIAERKRRSVSALAGASNPAKKVNRPSLSVAVAPVLVEDEPAVGSAAVSSPVPLTPVVTGASTSTPTSAPATPASSTVAPDPGSKDDPTTAGKSSPTAVEQVLRVPSPKPPSAVPLSTACIEPPALRVPTKQTAASTRELDTRSSEVIVPKLDKELPAPETTTPQETSDTASIEPAQTAPVGKPDSLLASTGPTEPAPARPSPSRRSTIDSTKSASSSTSRTSSSPSKPPLTVRKSSIVDRQTMPTIPPSPTTPVELVPNLCDDLSILSAISAPPPAPLVSVQPVVEVEPPPKVGEPEEPSLADLVESASLFQGWDAPLQLTPPQARTRRTSNLSTSPSSPAPRPRKASSKLTLATTLSLPASKVDPPSPSVRSFDGSSWVTSFAGGADPLDLHLVPQPTDARPLRVLSLDGGGVCGLSGLVVVRELMEAVKVHRGLTVAPRPCECFDLICGAGTGGILAILLGRLRLDVETAIDGYLSIARNVFGQGKGALAVALLGKTRYSASKLETAMIEVIQSAGLDAQARLAAGTEDGEGRTCVLASRAGETRALRSYGGDRCTIYQAARATSAVSSFFKTVAVEGSILASPRVHNPASEAVAEAHSLGGIAVVVSVGAGKIVRDAGGSGGDRLDRACADISASCEATAKAVEARAGDEGWPYRRFNVDRAFEGVRDWETASDVVAAAKRYMASVDVVGTAALLSPRLSLEVPSVLESSGAAPSLELRPF